MKLLVFAATLALLPVQAPAQQLDGSFDLRASERDDRVNLNLRYDVHSNYGRMFERSAFTDVNRSGDRITFTLRRDPGTFRFEGRGSLERASGSYEFVPNPDFRREMERLGFQEIDGRAQFVFAMDDLTVAKVKQLKQLVSNELATEDLIRLINHGAGVSYIQSMSELGFKNLSSDEYRRARDHGVSATFAKEMADLGIKLALPDLVRMRDHGVTAEYVKAVRAAGLQPDHDELVRARDHGVTADFLSRMRKLGLRDLPLADYVRMRDHGVTPEFVEALSAEGYKDLSVSELVRMRDHGVTASYVRRAKELYKQPPTVEQIIRMRSRGEIRDH